MRIFRVDQAAYFLGALLLLSLPLNWLFAALAAAAVHELFHIGAVLVLGGRVIGFHIGAGGAQIEIDGLSRGRELICALAGPLAGFLLLLLGRWIPRIALCALIQSIYNLFPIYPLDGGRALQCIGEMLPSAAKGAVLCRAAEWLALSVIVLGGIYTAFVLKWGILPLLTVLLMVLKKNTLQRRETRGTIVLPNTKR